MLRSTEPGLGEGGSFRVEARPVKSAPRRAKVLRLLRHQFRVDSMNDAIVGSHIGSHIGGYHLGIVHHRATQSANPEVAALHCLNVTGL